MMIGRRSLLLSNMTNRGGANFYFIDFGIYNYGPLTEDGNKTISSIHSDLTERVPFVFYFYLGNNFYVPERFYTSQNDDGSYYLDVWVNHTYTCEYIRFTSEDLINWEGVVNK